MFGEFLTFASVLFLGAVVFVLLGVKVVPQSYEWTVERFGRFTRTLTPGLHVIVPLIDRIGHKINRMEQVIDIARQDAITKDNASVQVDGVAFIQVFDTARAAYEVHNLGRAIVNLVMTNIRTVIGSMELDKVLSERDEINSKLLVVVNMATEAWGVKVTRVEIKDIQPPMAIMEAMSQQMIAEREKRALILKSEGERQEAINRAEGQKRAAIELAEGEKQAAILTAEGRLEAARRDADARERLAEAEANATAVVSKAIKAGEIHAVNYFLGLKYVEALEAIASAPNEKLVLMPLEAGNVIGAVSGIAELVKATKAG